MKVALAGFLHETNTFAPARADLAAFQSGGGYIPMVRGAAMESAARGVNLGISGALDHARAAGWEIRPLLWAGAIPSAHVTQSAYEAIADEIIDRLAAERDLDGVFLDLHGAMVAEHLDDGEGELVARVRRIVGPDVPIVAALDLHGNISAAMVQALDGLVGFRTYPHVDMAETGRRAAALLDRLMTGLRPAKAFRQMSYLVPIPFQSTDIAPGDALYRIVDEVEANGAWSASLFMGFPAADIPDCGPCAIAYAETQQGADAAADRLAAAYDAAEDAFQSRTWPAAEAVAEAQRLVTAGGLNGPVILGDTQDNPGAGGVSATTGLLRALVAADAQDAAIGVIVDPETARAAHAAGVGATIRCDIGGHPDFPQDQPFSTEAVVEALAPGPVHLPGGYYGGSTIDLGPSACLRIGGVRVAVTSGIAQTADREMFRFLGIEPETQKILAVKSSTHFRADFSPIAGAILIALAPGPMPFDPADLPFTRLRPGLRLSPNGPAFGTETQAARRPVPARQNG